MGLVVTILPLSPEVKAALVGIAIVVVVLALLFAAITLAKTEKLSRPTKEVTPTVPIKPAMESETVLPVAGVVKSSLESGAVLPVVAPEASFDISDLEISPLEAKEGEIVTISFLVTNRGIVSSYYRAELKINGKIVATKGVALAPTATKWVVFTVAEINAGIHKVEVGGLDGRFVVS